MQIQLKHILVLFLVIVSGKVFSQEIVVFTGGDHVTGVFEYGENLAGIDKNYIGFGFHGGASFESVITKTRKQELLFSLSLMGDYRMVKQETAGGGENKANLFYVNTPAYVFYRYKLRSRDKVYGGIGPFMGLGLFGNIMGDNVKWGSEEGVSHLKRLDYGVSGKIGFRGYSGLDISVSYDYSIPDIFSLFESGSLHNRVLRLSVGYAFSLVD